MELEGESVAGGLVELSIHNLKKELSSALFSLRTDTVTISVFNIFIQLSKTLGEG